ncbi:hypothetical protein [Halonotius roseus]|uniref:hypothetical protein n=1 Tax=Halonotius roseus TaxID=2511997 RepID=UPI00163BC10D|nr:hypothetical protein [Halonotius roseus]
MSASPAVASTTIVLGIATIIVVAAIIPVVAADLNLSDETTLTHLRLANATGYG